jgi:hypothetical protein
MLLQFAGYGQTTSGLPGLATTRLGVAPSIVGVALAANTAIILVTAPATRRFAHQHRDSTALGTVGLLWAAAWVLIAASTVSHAPQIIAAAVIAFYVIFGIGETLLAAVSTPLVATSHHPARSGHISDSTHSPDRLAERSAPPSPVPSSPVTPSTATSRSQR